jgi:phosphopantothenoylcysteine decarboxylase/phosphopantothenate--cysteine ligase
MNANMWAHPATQTNRRTLEQRGCHFLDPGVGRLAEGIVGAGRLAEPANIVRAVHGILLPYRDLAGLHVLVTAGPTREAIDPVRYLTNRSSGKMGYAIAEAAGARGARVTLVSGPVALPPSPGVETLVPVTSAAEMLAACFQHAPTADIVIAAAAVADYAPETVAANKIKKTGDDALTLTLRPTTDIAATLGQQKPPGQTLVGFAAETERLDENARAKLERKNLDLIVANDVTRPGAGFETDTNIVTLIAHNGDATSLPQMTKRQVADAILDRLVKLRTTTELGR